MNEELTKEDVLGIASFVHSYIVRRGIILEPTDFQKFLFDIDVSFYNLWGRHMFADLVANKFGFVSKSIWDYLSKNDVFVDIPPKLPNFFSKALFENDLEMFIRDDCRFINNKLATNHRFRDSWKKINEKYRLDENETLIEVPANYEEIDKENQELKKELMKKNPYYRSDPLSKKETKNIEKWEKSFKMKKNIKFYLKWLLIGVYLGYLLVDFFYGFKNDNFLSTITFHLGFIGVSLLSFRFKPAITILTLYNIFMSFLWFSSGHYALGFLMFYFIFINWYGILRK